MSGFSWGMGMPGMPGPDITSFYIFVSSNRRRGLRFSTCWKSAYEEGFLGWDPFGLSFHRDVSPLVSCVEKSGVACCALEDSDRVSSRGVQSNKTDESNSDMPRMNKQLKNNEPYFFLNCKATK